MPKYKTKPIIVEAEQWFKNSHEGAYDTQSENLRKVKRAGINKYVIDTKQREVEVFDGDFIITLEDGESYPCNPKVFHNKYELIREIQHVGDYTRHA